jgi:hypothetical protein
VTLFSSSLVRFSGPFFNNAWISGGKFSVETFVADAGTGCGADGVCANADVENKKRAVAATNKPLL